MFEQLIQGNQILLDVFVYVYVFYIICFNMYGVKFKQHQIISSFITYNINGNDNANSSTVKKIH